MISEVRPHIGRVITGKTEIGFGNAIWFEAEDVGEQFDLTVGMERSAGNRFGFGCARVRLNSRMQKTDMTLHA